MGCRAELRMAVQDKTLTRARKAATAISKAFKTNVEPLDQTGAINITKRVTAFKDAVSEALDEKEQEEIEEGEKIAAGLATTPAAGNALITAAAELFCPVGAPASNGAAPASGTSCFRSKPSKCIIQCFETSRPS